jgi:Bacterial Ig-like domain (group 2)
LQVVAPVLISIAVMPNNPSIPLGETLQLSAMGTFSDGTLKDLSSSVLWSTSSHGVTLSASGLVVASALGSAQVTASSGSTSGSDRLTVTPPALLSIAVVPKSATVVVGATQQLTATGSFSDGSTQDLTPSATWSSDPPHIALFRTPGLVYAQRVGTANIIATSAAIQGSATLVVSPPDATLRVINDGDTGGDLCSSIYVFDESQVLQECCSCRITPNGLLSESVNQQLTFNDLTGKVNQHPVLRVVSAAPGADGNCHADTKSGAVTPGLRGWLTHILAGGSGTYDVTETNLKDTTPTAGETSTLEQLCGFAEVLGSGRGVCSCTPEGLDF